jgi:hypothetical protein
VLNLGIEKNLIFNKLLIEQKLPRDETVFASLEDVLQDSMRLNFFGHAQVDCHPLTFLVEWILNKLKRVDNLITLVDSRIINW